MRLFFTYFYSLGKDIYSRYDVSDGTAAASGTSDFGPLLLQVFSGMLGKINILGLMERK